MNPLLLPPFVDISLTLGSTQCPPPVDIGDVWALQWAAVTPEFFLGKQSGSDKLMPFHEEQFLWVQPSCHYAFHNRTFAE